MRTVKLTIFPGSERRGRRGSLIEPFMHSPFMYVHEFVKGNGRKGGERGSNTRKMLNHATFCSLSDRAMKTVVSVAYPPLDGRRRASMLICFAFIIALPILASAHDQKNGHGSAYASKSEDKMEFSKNSKDSKISLLDDENDDSGVSKHRRFFFVMYFNCSKLSITVPSFALSFFSRFYKHGTERDFELSRICSVLDIHKNFLDQHDRLTDRSTNKYLQR